MIEVCFHGHSFVELILPTGSILIDPFISGNRLCDCTVEQITQKHILAICLTHGHSDHVGDTPQIAKATGCPVIAMVELCGRLAREGVANLEACNIGGSWQTETRQVQFVQAIHSNSAPDGSYAGVAAGLIIRTAGKTIYHAGDTGLFAEMHAFAAQKFDLAFLPIGDRYTMGVADALQAAARIKATIVVPMHFDTFPQIHADAQTFARELMAGNIAVPKVLKPGQAVVLS